MAKKTHQVAIDSPERIKAFRALLVVLGFEEVAPNEWVEVGPVKPAKATASKAKSPARRAAPAKPTATKPLASKSATGKKKK